MESNSERTAGATRVGTSGLDEQSEGGSGQQAAEQGRQLADSAKEQARGVQDTAKGEAGRVAEQAKQEGRDLLEEGRSTLKGQAQDQTQRIAGLLQGVGSDLEALLDGRADEAGTIGEYARTLTYQVQRYADQVEQRGFDGVMDDLRRFARQRPGVFLAASAAAGFLAGRVARGARDAQSGQDTDELPALPTGPTPAYGVTGTEEPIGVRPGFEDVGQVDPLEVEPAPARTRGVTGEHI